MGLLFPLFRADALERFWGDRARVRGMLDFEAALARAEGRTGVIPPSAALAIARRCVAEQFDLETLARGTALAGNPAIPLVQQLTALVARDEPASAPYVHWGATSQDAMDTGLVLQLRPSLEWIDTELGALAEELARRIDEHRLTLVAGRTWMQQAVPTSMGLKLVGWLDAVERHRGRVRRLRARALVLQFGGAVGSLAALGDKGLDVATALGEELKLPVPDLPWHAHRDRLAEVATVLGLALGTLGKIARDIALHGQTEVAELFEPGGEGRGGSSTMPHKRNPVGSAVVLAAAARVPGLVATMLGAMVQEDERGLGGWPAEWETLPELVSLFGGALRRTTETVTGLRVDADRMAANLEASHGLIFAEAVQRALSARMDGSAARKLVETACERARTEGRHLREVLEAAPEVSAHLQPEELALLFDPRRYLGVADRLIDRVLASRAAGMISGEEG